MRGLFHINLYYQALSSKTKFLIRYDLALLYLTQAEYKLDDAIRTYMADEQWEKEHPLEKSRTGKNKLRLGN